jgi:hypothetical protein
VTESELKIAYFIKHYLFAHNELCVAGIGRFVCNISEFSIEPISKVISPKHKTINFSQGNFETTPEFITFLKDNSNISYLDDKLAIFGLSLRAAILPGKRLEIDGFGYFKFNVLGELDFEPIKTLSFEKSTFGLGSIHFAANLHKVKRMDVSSEEDEDEALTIMRESALKELKVMLDQAKISESVKENNNSKLFPVITTVLTLILLVNLGLYLYSGPVDYLKSQVSTMGIFGKTGEVIESKFNESLKFDSILPKESVINKESDSHIDLSQLSMHVALTLHKDSFYFDSLDYIVFDLVQTESIKVEPQTILVKENINNGVVIKQKEDVIQKIESQPLLIEDEEIEIVNVDAAFNNISIGFYVIAGAFKGEDNANNLTHKLRKTSYKDAISFKPEQYPLHLVAYGVKSSLEKAKATAERIKSSGRNVWIYAAN